MAKTLPLLLLLIALAISCTPNQESKDSIEIATLKTTIDSLQKSITQHKSTTMNDIVTFLTFQDNNAENAMNFYVALFENSEITSVQRWAKGAPGEEGKIMHAAFTINGRPFMCSDSPPVHDWDFSPAVSNYIDCANEAEQERLYSALSDKGTITMPLNNYGFSQKFGWVIDQYGISWQLNLK